HDSKQPAERDETAGESVVGDQVLRQRSDVDRGPAVTRDDKPDDEPAAVRAEPAHGGGRGGGVAEAHADAAEDAEAEDQPEIPLHPPGEDAARAQAHARESGPGSRAVTILEPA